MTFDSQHYKILNELSEKYNIPIEEIDNIRRSPFKFIREKIKSINLIGNENEKEFKKKTKNFNIPSIGKLYANYYSFKKINKIN